MWHELVLPATDPGAIGQMVGVVGCTAIAAYVLRGNRDLRWLAVGIGVALFSLMALRTVH